MFSRAAYRLLTVVLVVRTPRDCELERPRTLTFVSRGSAAHHPLWWIALVLLVVNDHVLKGAGLLPAWLSGKLSDFTGLVVAPGLSSMLLRSRTTKERLFAFAPVVSLFVAIKTSPTAARALENAVALAGIKWRIWADPTDLVALCVLPLSFSLATRRELRRRDRSTTRLELLAALLGGLACAATSDEVDRVNTAAYLVNATHGVLTVDVDRAATPIDCTLLSTEPDVALRGITFDHDECASVELFEPQPLDSDAQYLDRNDPSPADGDAPRPCDAVRLRARGLDPVVVAFAGTPKKRIDLGKNGHMPEELNHVVLLEQVGDRLYLSADPTFVVRPDTSPSLSSECPDSR